MKKLLFMLMMICSMHVMAQDVIVKTDGSTIVCRVQNLTTTEVVYKKWSDLKGSNYVMSLNDVSTINYENGRNDQLFALNNKYAPSNQNSGYGQLNDNALIAMDMATSNPAQKAKTLKIIGLIGGGIFVATGLGLICYGAFDRADKGFDDEAVLMYGIGGGISAIGLIGGGICLLQSHKYQRQAELVQSYSLLQQDYHFNDGSSLSAGVDLLKDDVHKYKTVGIGLRYNF